VGGDEWERQLCDNIGRSLRLVHQSIPTPSSSLPPSPALVRIKGMVQNMEDPQFFPAIFEVTREGEEKTKDNKDIRCGMFRNLDLLEGEVLKEVSLSLSQDEEGGREKEIWGKHTSTRSRFPILVSDSPGQTPWASSLDSGTVLSNSQRKKDKKEREREETNGETRKNTQESISLLEGILKRERSGDQTEDESGEIVVDKRRWGELDADAFSKRIKISTVSSSSSSSSSSSCLSSSSSSSSPSSYLSSSSSASLLAPTPKYLVYLYGEEQQKNGSFLSLLSSPLLSSYLLLSFFSSFPSFFFFPKRERSN